MDTKLTISDIRYNNLTAGHKFFSRGAMKFFRSRVLRTVYQGPGGIYFVTGEMTPESHTERYTVRQYDPQSHAIKTVGRFCALGQDAAREIARTFAREGHQ